MKKTFTFDLVPVSTNSLTRVVNNRPIKSSQARQFNNNIQQLLRWGQNKKCIDLKAHFKPEKHGIKICMDYYSPNVCKKSGGISRRSGDVDNFLKQYIDSIFKFIGIDDAFITHITASKIQSDNVNVEFTIEIYEI